VPTLAVGRFTNPFIFTLAPFPLSVFAVIGFIDDYAKVSKHAPQPGSLTAKNEDLVPGIRQFSAWAPVSLLA